MSTRRISGLALAALGGVLLACSGGPSDPGDQVSQVVVTPATATITALGDTLQLSATAKDVTGRTIAGLEFTWSSSSEDVAHVDSDGRVAPAGNGITEITAMTSGVSGQATIVVSQVVDSVIVTPDSIEVTSPFVLLVDFNAEAFDATGHLVNGATFTWASSDPSVALVNAFGQALPLDNGVSTIRATASGVSDDAILVVNR